MGHGTLTIRQETPFDRSAITDVNRAAFGGEEESTLVTGLREDGLVITSLVAVDAEHRLVGHILFSRARIGTAKIGIEVANLAPMAVLPSHQRQGIGGRLIREGIEACRKAGCGAIIVLGHRDYYPKFGFSPGIVKGIKNPFTDDDAFMGLELISGFLKIAEGKVEYPSAFGGV